MTPDDFAILTDSDPVPERLRGAVVAIGNFDGVHRGHQSVLDRVKAMAAERGVAALALTFEPHPRTFFRPETPVFRLTPAPVKAELMAALGLNGVVEVGFDRDLAAMTAEEFVDRLLVERLGVGAAVVGYDFHFGRNRSGSPDALTAFGADKGFDVEIVAPAGENDLVWSASGAREMLAGGRVEDATRILGYHWFVIGTVQHGDKRGRNLGYPTANIALSSETALMHGVYAVRLHVEGIAYDGAANFGRRPQFDNGPVLLEVYCLDSSPDLYGKTVEVEFIAFIRPEQRFDSVEALVERMHIDVEVVRGRLADAVEADKAGALLPVFD